MNNQIVHAPIQDPQLIIDIGCGTGVVTRLLGQLYPRARDIYGVDLSPVPPPRSTSTSPQEHATAASADQPQNGDPSVTRFAIDPPSVSFVQARFHDLLSGPASPGAPTSPPASASSSNGANRFACSTFDYAFSRLLVCGITDWPGHVRDVLSLLRPGGWAEMQDLSYFWTRDGRVCSREWKWLQALKRGAAAKGLDVECGEHIAGYMRDAGFVDVSVKTYEIPHWKVGSEEEGGEGEARRVMAEHSLRENWVLYWHLLHRLVKPLGYKDEEIEGFRREMRECLREERGKRQPFWVTVGRRPD